MTLKEKIRLTARGYRSLHELVPGLMLTICSRALLAAFSPFINIFLSALIINALAQGQSFQQILSLIFLTVLLNVGASLLSSGLSRRQSFFFYKFWLVAEQPLNEKVQQMDYELVENPEIHLKKQQIITLRNANGLGLPRLIWCTEGLIQGAASVIFSVSLLSTAFTLSYSTDPGGWSFLYSPWSIVLIIALIALNIMLNTFITKKSIKKFMAFSSEFVPLSRLSEYYFQSLSQYNAGKDMRIYALNQISLKEFQNAFLGINKTMGKLCKFQARYDSAVAVSSTVLSGLIYAFVALKALFGSFAVGNIVQYVGSLSKLGSGVTSLMNNLALLNANADTLRLFYEFTDMPSVKYQGTLPVEKRNDNEYELEFHNVSFRYPGSDAYALKNLSLKLRVGQRMAVVGMNGSGKTTMIKLLCRLYDPTEGRITLNGIDIRKYDYSEYLSIFGVVFQDFKLFSFELGQNVAASVEVDEGKAEHTLQEAGFGVRMSAMAKGLHTPLYKDFDEDGVEISGGEAQKIALARALYKEAPFIVLDEPTAALDPISEYEIYTRFNEIVGDKTAVFISHRLSSCRFCDDIAVFNKGELVQRGSHDVLLADEKGKYYELWHAQAQYYT